MKERTKKILLAMITEYIDTAVPVASGFLVKKIGDHISSATVRNEFVQLEKDGYIWQPHTSAGRIPTEKGYYFYIQENGLEMELPGTMKSQLNRIMANVNYDQRQKMKELAKLIAEYSGETIMFAFAKNDIYYTGLSNLFAKPEFDDKDKVVDISRVIDHLEKVVENMFEDFAGPEIKIGVDCPISSFCGSIFIKTNRALMATIGPMRMNYPKNYALLNYVSQITK